jgi:hypothetical protein
MTGPLVRTTEYSHRCQCGTLLCIERQGALHLKYKQFSATVHGVVDMPCRRCGRPATIASSQ